VTRVSVKTVLPVAPSEPDPGGSKPAGFVIQREIQGQRFYALVRQQNEHRRAEPGPGSLFRVLRQQTVGAPAEGAALDLKLPQESLNELLQRERKSVVRPGPVLDDQRLGVRNLDELRP
jgi:hypothetical protein